MKDECEELLRKLFLRVEVCFIIILKLFLLMVNGRLIILEWVIVKVELVFICVVDKGKGC